MEGEAEVPPAQSTSKLPENDGSTELEATQAPALEQADESHGGQAWQAAEDGPAPPMSKNAMKRLAKQAAFAAAKPARRAAEREKKKEKKAEKRRLVDAGLLDPKELATNKKKQKLAALNQKPYNARIVIDLAFDDKMVEKEIVSMSSQMSYCYSIVRRAPHVVQLLSTSTNGRLKDKLEKMDYLKWKNLEWWEQGYEDLWRAEDAPGSRLGDDDGGASDEEAGTGKRRKGRQQPARCAKDDVIYLSGDSPNVLQTIDEGKTYIIGGIVDKNRYKRLCLDKAKAGGIKHAALPIGQYMPEIVGRKVLTVNQVVEILVNWVECRDWKQALLATMPQRKVGQAVAGGKDEEGGSGEEDEEAEEEDSITPAAAVADVNGGKDETAES